MSEPCKDNNDESFRQAYNRMNKEYIQAKAEVKHLQKQLEITSSKVDDYLNIMSRKIDALENYCAAAVELMDPYTRNKFISKFGNPPQSIKIS